MTFSSILIWKSCNDLQPSFDILEELSKDYDNVGTVIQAYFYQAEEDIQKYKNFRLRIVKGAYKEPANIAYQTKARNRRKLYRAN